MSLIDVKQAEKAAVQYLDDIRDLIDSGLKDIRSEEIELLEAQSLWLVTLGYEVPHQPSQFDRLLGADSEQYAQTIPYQRQYKTFQVNADTGEVQSMKIRLLS